MKVEAEARGWAPTGYKGFTRTEDAIRAFMKARVETVRRSLRMITEHDLINSFAKECLAMSTHDWSGTTADAEEDSC